MIEALRQLGEGFPPESYLFWTRIQGTLWTLADFVIVYYLLRIGDVCRTFVGKRRHVGSYILLAATLPFATLLPVVPTGAAVFRLELAVTIPHFLLILYACWRDSPIAAAALHKRHAQQYP